MDKLLEAKTKLVTFVGNKEVDKKIQALEKEVEAVLKSKDQAKKETIANKILTLLGEDNIYVEKRKTDLNNLFKKLTETSSSSPTDSPKPFPWVIIIPVALLVILILALVIVTVRKRKENERVIN